MRIEMLSTHIATGLSENVTFHLGKQAINCYGSLCLKRTSSYFRKVLTLTIYQSGKNAAPVFIGKNTKRKQITQRQANVF